MQQMDKHESWRISIEERTKHDTSFNQLNPVNGFLTGEQAREFFLKSNLATTILGQVWNLADLNKDGKLDKKEFSIACFLIKKVLTNGPTVLPSTLPSQLLIEPTSIMSTPLIAPAPVAAAKFVTPMSTPLFQASFPTSNSLTGISSIAASTPLNLTSTLPATPILYPQSSTPRMPLQIQAGVVSIPTNNSIYQAPQIPIQALITPGQPITPLTGANTIPNPIAPIPQTSRTKYAQMFQSNDTNSTGFIAGQQAKTLLMQTGLPQTVLAQIWNMADHDQDGKLSFEEFILAMHLCDFSKSGNLLPSILPLELHPSRTKSATMAQQQPQVQQVKPQLVNLNASISPEALNPTSSDGSSSPTFKQKQQQLAATFEDKRKENFDRGNAVLEAKRQMLREIEEREKREREEKEKIEQEKKQKLKEEQERRRLAEIEKQMERQRQLDMQREEERKKIFEQREAARNELIRQQRLEWERQKKQELETQKLKLQEQLSTLKAKDKNLEYDMQILNDKISAYKTKISDTQSTLNDLNNKLDTTRKSYLLKQSEVEIKEKELRDYMQNLSRIAQEKLYLSEQQKNLTIDNPFAEEYRNDSMQLKSKQMVIQTLKSDLEAMESQINNTRTQLEVMKHEMEFVKSDEVDIIKENNRLEKLLELKRNSNEFSYAMNNTNASFVGKPLGKSDSVSNITSAQNLNIFKTSQSTNNLRSATPKENYDAFKNEIIKIQQATALNTNNPISSLPKQQTTDNGIFNDPFANSSIIANEGFVSPTLKNTEQKTDFGVDWSNAFDQSTKANESASNSDPFSSFNAFDNKNDPFNNMGTGVAPQSNDFESIWSSQNKALNQPSNNLFDAAFNNTNKTNLTASNSINGFDDDNWAASLTNEFSNQIKNKNIDTPAAASISPTSTNNNNDNWAAFTDENPNSVKNTISLFNQTNAIAFPKTNNAGNLTSPIKKNNAPNNVSIKYRAEYTFDATREDELSIKKGDIINVDLSIKTDEGWIWGECQSRTGVFPASFTIKLSDLESIQEESLFANDFQQNTLANNIAQQQLNTNNVPTSFIGQATALADYISNQENHLSFNQGSKLNLIEKKEQWWMGELNGKYGWFPETYINISNGQPTASLTATTPLSPTASTSFASQYVSSNQISSIKNYFISIYPYASNEIGDLTFKDFEIINVIDKNEDWLTGQIVGSGTGPTNPLRSGIFPSNFVIKFNFPIEYVGKYTIAMATEAYQAQTSNEMSLNIDESQLIAMKKLSPDGKWSFGESYDSKNKLNRGWFPAKSVMPLIDASAIPLYVPQAGSASSTPNANATINNNNGNNFSVRSPSMSSMSSSPPPPPSSSSDALSTSPTKNITQELPINSITATASKNNINVAEKQSENSVSAAVATAQTPLGVNSNGVNNKLTKTNSIKRPTTSNSIGNIAEILNNSLSKVKTSTSENSIGKKETPTIMTPAIKTPTSAGPIASSVQATQLPNGFIDQVVALYDFQSTTPETIGFPKDAIINIIEKSGDWWLGDYNGKMGLLPYNYVQSVLKMNG